MRTRRGSRAWKRRLCNPILGPIEMVTRGCLKVYFTLRGQGEKTLIVNLIQLKFLLKLQPKVHKEAGICRNQR